MLNTLLLGKGSSKDFLVGLTGPNSNYKMLSEKVKAIKVSIPVKSESNQVLVDSSYDPNSIVKGITQQQKHLKPEEIEQIVQRYQNGESTYELAEAFNCHRSTIANNLRKQGVKVSIEKINLEEAIKLYESGWTTKQLAERYHISDNAVSRRLKKAGVKMRARWDYLRD